MTLEDLYRLLRNSHVQTQGIIDTLPMPLLLLGQELQILDGNRAFFDTFQVSRDETVGQFFYDLGNGQWNVPELRLLLENIIPRSTAITDFEINHAFPGIGKRTMLVSARRLFHRDNTATKILLSFEDATRKREIDAEREMLLGELRHRLKNSLAVIHSLAAQTAVEGRSAEEYRDAFLGRLQALVRASNIGANERQDRDLMTLLRGILAPYVEDPERVVIEPGPPTMLPSAFILPLNLILHELATNAVKYGALATAQGSVRVSWRPEGEEGNLILRWQERDGPSVQTPTQLGFGTRLIRFVAERELGGFVELTFAAEGLEAAVGLPQSPPDSGPAQKNGARRA